MTCLAHSGFSFLIRLFLCKIWFPMALNCLKWNLQAHCHNKSTEAKEKINTDHSAASCLDRNQRCYHLGLMSSSFALATRHLSGHNITGRACCPFDPSFVFFLQYVYSALEAEFKATINVRRKNKFHIDSAEDLYGGHSFMSSVCVCELEEEELWLTWG